MDSICAPATGQGGAIAIIRVSGDDAISIAESIFTPAGGGLPLSAREGYSIAYGTISDDDGSVVDDVLVSVFRAPHSYTGENSVEISCHASLFIQQTVMRLLINHGCRAAEPGEYTRRAFINGKMDLSQAEAVADLIASTSAAAHRMAVSQMRGAFSRQLSTLRDKLLAIASLMELELDFSDHEELRFANRNELDALTADVEATVSHLAASFATGDAIKNGIPVAIIGPTNVGKSTLLNALTGDDRAIVSDIGGTTRDIIEDTIIAGGIKFRIIDTAGIRDTADKIEALGIERSLKAIEKARIVLLVCEYGDSIPPCFNNNLQPGECAERHKCAKKTAAPAPIPTPTLHKAQDEQGTFIHLYEQLHTRLEGKKVVLLVNKSDKAGDTPLYAFSNHGNDAGQNSVLLISALKGTNLDTLRKALVSLAGTSEAGETGVIVANARHYEALKLALNDIRRVRQGITSQLPTDLICEDLRQCLRHLGEITGGEITSQETLNNIFSHFCIGK